MAVYDDEEKEPRSGPSSGLRLNAEQLAEHQRREKERTAGKGGKGEMNLAAAAGIMAMANADDTLFPPAMRGIEKTIKRLKRYKKVAAGGAAVGTLGASIAVLLVLVIPLKIEHIISNIQSRFFASSQQAVDGEIRNIFTDYVKKYVLPSYRKCGTTISKECNVHLTGQPGSNPVKQLYKGWADARLENKLALRGIELKYDTASGTWKLKTPSTSAEGDDIGSDGQGLEKEFSSRAEVRAALSDAMEKETKWYEIMFRYKVGRLAEEKYSIKRCIIFCNARDQLAGKIADQKQAAKLFLAERVIQPRDQMTFVAIKCLLDSNCNPAKTSTTPCTEGEDCEMNGAPLSDTDREMGTTLQQLAEQFGIEDVAALEKLYNDIAEKGMQQYLIEQVLTVVIGEDAAKVAAGNISDALPIIGWINLASQVIKDANDAGPKLKKLAFAVNAAAAIQLFMMYRSYADEIHTGHVNPTEVGSMVDSFSSGNHGVSTDPEVGGTAGAEGTPIYANMFDNSATINSKSATLLGSLLPVKAYAASTSSTTATPSYLCNNGQGVPAGKLVCPEEALGQGNGVANAIHTFLNLPGVDVLNVLNRIWLDTGGLILGWLGDLLSWVVSPLVQAFDKAPCIVQDLTVPGYCQAKAVVLGAVKLIMKAVVNWLIPNPFSTNMSGGRNLDMTVAGGDALGNEYTHNGLGGEEATPAQAAAVVNDQLNQQQMIFSHQPLFARIFSTDSQFSLVSRLAMDVPIDFQSSVRNGFASLISNPLGALSHSFAVILSGKANAAVAAQPDPFDVVQYYYPQNKIPQHAADYWDQHCSDGADGATTQAWDQAAASGPVDPNSGMPVNTDVDPCLLIQASAGSGAGYFTQAVLTSDDLADTNGSTSSPVGSSGYQNPFHDESNIVASRIDEGADFASTQPVPIYAIGPGVVTQVAKGDSTFYKPLPNWITYKLTSGPASGKFVYVAEECPPLVNIGDTVGPNTGPLCNVMPQSIETGWALDATSQAAAAYGTYTESNATGWGQNFYELLQSIGLKTKECYDHPGQKLQGTATGYPNWVANPATTAGSLHC